MARAARWAIVLLALPLILPLLGITAPAPAVQAQSSKVYTWDRYDVSLTINKDGSFDAVETQTFRYQSGTFRGAARAWDTNRLGEITQVQINEGKQSYSLDGSPTGQGSDGTQPYTEYTGPYDLNSPATLPPPGTFVLRPGGNSVEVDWFYAPVAAPATRTFTLRYHVTGAIRVYPGGDQLWWNPIIANRQADITSSGIAIHLPAGVNATNVQAQTVFPKSTHTSVNTAGVVSITTDEPILQTDPAPAVRVQWPHGMLAADPPAWQAADDADRARAEESQREAQRLAEEQRLADARRVAFVDLGLLVASALILVGGLLFWLVRWYRSGRDTPTALAADYLTTPPSDLPPGLVGVLVDERADTRDVVSTILDLGRRGNIVIEELKINAFGERLPGADYKYTLKNAAVAQPYEKRLLDDMFQGDKTVHLSSLAFGLSNRLAAVYGDMYAALVDLKYFTNRPDMVRATSFSLARRFLVLGGVALLITGFLAIFGDYGFWPLVLPLALALVGAIGVAINRALPQRTALGAAEAAKWLAFGRYLKNTAQYTGVEEAAAQGDRYLPYAVALGADEALVTQFQAQSISVASPGWFIPWRADEDTSGLSATSAGEGGVRLPNLSGIFANNPSSSYDYGSASGGHANGNLAGWKWGDDSNNNDRSSERGFAWSAPDNGGSARNTAESWNRDLADTAENTNSGLANMISVVADALFSGSGSSSGGSSSSSSSSSFGSSSSSSSSSHSSSSGGGSSGGSGGGGSGGAF